MNHVQEVRLRHRQFEVRRVRLIASQAVLIELYKNCVFVLVAVVWVLDEELGELVEYLALPLFLIQLDFQLRTVRGLLPLSEYLLGRRRQVVLLIWTSLLHLGNLVSLLLARFLLLLF